MRGVISSRIYQATAPLAALSVEMIEVGRLDALKERLRVRWWIIAAVAAVVAVAMAFWAKDDPNVFAGVVGFLGLVSFPPALARAWWHGRLDLPNWRYELAAKVLRLLEADTDPQANARLRIDLRPTDHKSKRVRKGSIGPWKVEFFTNAWLSLSGRLVDGTRYALSITEKHQVRSRWKHTGRKSKKKVKTNTSHHFCLVLRTKPERYGALDRLQSDLKGAIKLPRWAVAKPVEFTPDTLTLRTSVPRSLSSSAQADLADLPAMMFLSLYQVLNLLRTLVRSNPNPGNPP